MARRLFEALRRVFSQLNEGATLGYPVGESAPATGNRQSRYGLLDETRPTPLYLAQARLHPQKIEATKSALRGKNVDLRAR